MMFLIFIAYPVLEIFTIYRFVKVYSFGDALLLMLTTAVLGLLVMSIQGRATLFTLQSSLAQGRTPGNAILHRTLVMFGGFLLFVPGILSDLIGILFILPGTRHLLLFALKAYLLKRITQGFFRFQFRGATHGTPRDFDWDSSGPMRDVVDVQPKEVTHTTVEKPE